MQEEASFQYTFTFPAPFPHVPVQEPLALPPHWVRPVCGVLYVPHPGEPVIEL